jgi:2-amino-4-hydroxy-6-hydroxymethyldihydropteridine diphosphokinase
MSTRCFIAVGSNQGNRWQHLHDACHQLPVTRVAPIYETDPVDCPPDSLPFLNSVVEIHWKDSASALHRLTKSIESTLGRPEVRDHHAPRPIDLDILAMGDAELHSPELIIPHPRLHLRRFVLQPFADLSPDLILPGFNHTLAELLLALKSDEPPLIHHSLQWKLPLLSPKNSPISHP